MTAQKTIMLPLLAALTAALLAACGGGSTTGPAAPADGPLSGGDPMPVPVPAPAPAPIPAPAPAPAPTAATPTAVGVNEGLAVSLAIGPAGGRLATPDGQLTVVVPAGAFTAPTVLTLQPISNHAHGGVGRAWRITPHQVVAAKPITLEWRYSAEDAPAMASLAVATQRADGSWAALRNAQHDPAQRLVRVQTRHFSDWSLVAGLQIRPARALVEVGGRLALSITHCRTVNVSNDEPEIPLAECTLQADANFDDLGWAANGVRGGNAQHGRVVKPSEFLFPGSAAYLAPAAVPAGNPVALSISFLSSAPFNVPTTVVSQVQVVQATSGCAWLQNVQTLSAEVEARYTWAGNNGPFKVDIDHSATVGGTLQRVPSQLPILHWRGALAGGQVRVNERRTLGSGPTQVIETETGAGTPFLGDNPASPVSSANVMVDLLRCKFWVSTSFDVTTERATNGLPAATTSQGGGGFAISERDIGPWRLFAGNGAIPAVGGGDFPDRYFPGGLNNALVVEQAGSADVRWLFRPQY